MTDEELEYAMFQVESDDVLNRTRKFMENLVFKHGYNPEIVAHSYTTCGLLMYDQLIDNDGDYDIMLERNRILGQQIRKESA